MTTNPAVGDEVDAWLPPPNGYKPPPDTAHDTSLESGSRRRAIVVSNDGSRLRVREANGEEHDIDAADLGEAQPEWVGKK